MLVRAKNVSKSFPGADGRRIGVISDLSLEMGHQSITTLVGANGSGKTTMLNLFAGILEPDSGSIEIVTEHEGAPHVGYVWQDYRESLMPWFDVGENIAFPMRIRGKGKSERRRVASDLLSQFTQQIQVDQRVSGLSGGQQQLVSILRSLVVRPDVMLLDEPFSALDQQTRWTMTFHLERIWMENKMPILFVSHDVDEAIMIADEVLLMSRQRKGIFDSLKNPLPRPRNAQMLTSSEHLACRNRVIEFLVEEGAVEDRSERKAPK